MHNFCIHAVKLLMKKLFLYLSALLLTVMVSCGTTSGLPKAQVNALLSSGEFTFMAERANPTNYDVVNVMNSFPNSSSSRMLTLDYGYTVQIRKSEVKVELPYFGRSFTPSYDTTKSSYRFTSKDFNISQRDGKKGSVVYTILPNDQPNVQKITVEVYPQGKAYVAVSSNDRQGISYDGYIMANEQAKK
ncbi:hypothetical protein FIC_00118 [Flavobacteriaceae bacterium 3519-10]|nr:hypothetical protein FIC_00118 [Flavobacteriaceae bacterium 3519-10]